MSKTFFSGLRLLFKLLTRQENIKWLKISFFASFSGMLEMLTAIFVAVFAQVLTQPEKGQKYLTYLNIKMTVTPNRTVFYFCIALGGLYLVKNAIAAVEAFYQNMSLVKMSCQFRQRLLEAYVRGGYSTYIQKNSSEGYQIVGPDTDYVFSQGLVGLASIISEGFILIWLVGVIIYINPSLALLMGALAGVIGLLISKFFLSKFYNLGQKYQNSFLSSTQFLLQFFHGFKEVLLYGKEKFFINAYQIHAKEKQRSQALTISLNTLPRLGIEILFVGLFVFAISYMCLNHESPAEILSILGAYFYAGFRLMPGLNRLINQMNTFKSSIPFIERIYEETQSLQKENTIQDTKISFDEKITVKNVFFSYPLSKSNVLKDVSFEIKKGESVGIIGETGSGKSTIVDLLLGLMKPTEGNILLDEEFHVTSRCWHRLIGYVPQSIYLTDSSIEENIAFGIDKIDKKKLYSAIDAAQLSQLVQKLPLKEKTIVGERGIRLSGGEQQRIAIARALYHDPQVLIFDEATSALDTKTEKELMKTINQLCENRTVIMIAHRLSTLEKCHKIIRMADGKIKEITSFKNLSKV